MKKIGRRDLLKAAAAAPLVGAAGSTPHAADVPGGTLVHAAEKAMSEAEYLAQVVPGTPGITYELWNKVARIIEDRASRLYQERAFPFKDAKDNMDDYLYGRGVLRTCYTCNQDDFAENVKRREAPIYNFVCDECWENFDVVLAKLIDESFNDAIETV